MRVARAYFQGIGIVTVNLGQDIKSLDSAKFRDNEDLLKKKLLAENDSNLVGISDFVLGKITYLKDGTYSGIVYASTQPLKGQWTID